MNRILAGPGLGVGIEPQTSGDHVPSDVAQPPVVGVRVGPEPDEARGWSPERKHT